MSGGVHLGFGEISALLPHGRAMVLVDRIWIAGDGRSAVATKAVSGTEYCFREAGAGCGYPESLVVESFGQAAAVLWLHGRAGDGRLPMFAAARDCVFAGRVPPGTTLTHELELEHASDGSAMVSGRTRAGAEPVAAFGSLIAVAREAPGTDAADGPPVREER
ncbi:beta-hydroxyacyl-ACP dehydratase [Amycolatopsis rubida]|uniref:3-hydroxyacyl-[acyl-carrier-protein] dehydratase n=1 Tax=Amycolatopsis rubida TaxID=112413 RepID=A0A1I5S9U7_9PSEU|nr:MULTISPECIES: hypothetical protein [Amycolatopsis]MYW93122.1 beta-hydroxyacyl-ACP dehydratase [Amycolatopsis rubida]NEC58109.1 beta-hydroxyacyl-ACP dehydratase [Amycolatopsis rubida]OAP22850.1 3-hydroxyacyl-[acyl-carrier-protein] dehydratase FabZ [Amycolatopsis sp. M39]SFP67524.1 3-hydroxyacyl-[acyl-carrier-protein] dehydratase [Amycolatopsis rubida]